MIILEEDAEVSEQLGGRLQICCAWVRIPPSAPLSSILWLRMLWDWLCTIP